MHCKNIRFHIYQGGDNSSITFQTEESKLNSNFRQTSKNDIFEELHIFKDHDDQSGQIIIALSAFYCHTRDN